MASLLKSALLARSTTSTTPKSHLIFSKFSSSSPSKSVSQASLVSPPSLKNVESFTALHRLNSPPKTQSKGFIVKTTPKISVVFRSIDVPRERFKFVLPSDGGETAKPAKMTIALTTFDKPVFDSEIGGNWVRLPQKIKRFTVLRSTHVHKKSREQFEIRLKKQVMVLHTTDKEEWKRKLFWLKNGRQFLN